MLNFEQNCISFHQNNESLLQALSKAPINQQALITIDNGNQTKSNLNLKKEIESLLNVQSTSSNQVQPIKVPLSNYRLVNWNWMKNQQETEKVIYSNDSKSVCLHPYCSGCFETNAVRGEQVLKKNAFTYWQVEVGREALSGTSTMIGIGKLNSKLNSIGYLNLIGIDKSSWGLSNKGILWHDNSARKYCEQFSEQQESIKIGCLFDGFSGRLSFFINGQFMGYAFEGIPLDQPLYPMISSTVTKSLFKLEFACETFPSLQEICRSQIYQSNELMQQLDRACLPKIIVNYLNNY